MKIIALVIVGLVGYSCRKDVERVYQQWKVGSGLTGRFHGWLGGE